jgi:hypothetical protein
MKRLYQNYEQWLQYLRQISLNPYLGFAEKVFSWGQARGKRQEFGLSVSNKFLKFHPQNARFFHS